MSSEGFTSTDHVHCLACGAAVEVETVLDGQLGYVTGRYPAAHVCQAAEKEDRD